MQNSSPLSKNYAQRGARAMMTSVPVAVDQYESLTFLGATAKKQYTEERMEWERKPQKTKNGLPVWSVQLAAMKKGFQRADMITVDIPAAASPSEQFGGGELVQLTGWVFGVNPIREGTAFTIWQIADSIFSAGERSRRTPATASA
jgi:hypothetical protein